MENGWQVFGDFVQAHMQAKAKEMEASSNDGSFEVREADILQCLIASSQGEGHVHLSEKEVVGCHVLCLHGMLLMIPPS